MSNRTSELRIKFFPRFISIVKPNAKTEEREMINLLQENIEMNSQRTNSTFVFCRHAKTNPKKTKELFFAYA